MLNSSRFIEKKTKHWEVSEMAKAFPLMVRVERKHGGWRDGSVVSLATQVWGLEFGSRESM